METFLRQTANYLAQKYGDKLNNCVLVLPGKRSVFFLKRELANCFEKPFFAPQCFSIEDFMSYLAQAKPAEPKDELEAIYKAHLEIESKKTKPAVLRLNEFAPKAKIMLQDFYDIDIELVDHTAIFENISQIKELSLWGEVLSNYQKDYLQFFKELGQYYRLYIDYLACKNKMPKGVIYRTACQQIVQRKVILSAYKYIFIGFNALTKSEEEIIRFIKQEQKLDYLVDADSYYLSDTNREAGVYLRKHKDFYQEKNPFIGEFFAKEKKEIQIIGLPQSLAQVKYLPTILQELKTKNKDSLPTAVIPADETLLQPLLHAVDFGKANITMGFPLKKSGLYQLVEMLVQTRMRLETFDFKTENTIYQRDLVQLLTNPYISATFSKNEQKAIDDLFKKKATIFCQKNVFDDLPTSKIENFSFLLQSIFDKSLSTNQFITILIGLLASLTKLPFLSEKEINVASHLLACLNDLEKQVNEMKIEDIDSLKYLLQTNISSYDLSFQSDSVNQLQLLGVLETRALDFDNIILLSVNEGVLPSAGNDKSFITFDLRRHFKMQTPDRKNAVFAYHFYRLLQRSSTIYLLYSLDVKDAKMEKSRFLLQMEKELASFPNITISSKVITYPNPEVEEMINGAPKTEKIMERLATMEYSATSINQYLQCPYQFYLERIARIEKPNEALQKDSIPANVMGTIIHHILENEGKQNFQRKRERSEIEKMVLEAYCNPQLTDNKQLNESDLKQQYNYMVFHTTIEYINNYLQKIYRENRLFAVKETEQDLSTVFPFQNYNLSLKGRIDRVDIDNEGNRMILDYKTGSVSSVDCKIKNMEDLKNKSKALQLYFYAYLYHRSANIKTLTAAIVGLRNLKEDLVLKIDDNTQISNFDEFEEFLTDIFSSIFDRNSSFFPQQGTACKYCPYTILCNAPLQQEER